MTTITPAVLPHSWSELEEGLERLHNVADTVQIDVVKDIFTGKEGLPHWEEMDFEFDIYVEPMEFVARAVELGAVGVVVHARHATARTAMEFLQQYRGGDFATRVGIGLKPTDTPEELTPFEGLYDFVQVMGIDHEGKQGEPFDPRALELVRTLRAAYPALNIQVDGAATGHAQELARAGANALVVGSQLMRAENPEQAYKELYTLVNVSH